MTKTANLPVPVTTPPALPSVEVLKDLVCDGNLAKLTPAQKVDYYNHLCTSLSLNPLTRPFQFLILNNKLVLYPAKDCTDQLRRVHKVSIKIVSRKTEGDVYEVVAQAKTWDGRQDEAAGTVSVKGKTGDDLANARMRAETKAKRRATLSIVGLGMIDESELETIRGVKKVAWDDALAPELPDFGEPQIGEDKYQDLVDRATKKGWTVEELRELYKVDNLRELTSGQYEDALKRIKLRQVK